MPSNLPEEIQYAFEELCRYLPSAEALDQANLTVTNFRARGLNIKDYDFIEEVHPKTFEQQLIWLKRNSSRVADTLAIYCVLCKANVTMACKFADCPQKNINRG